MGSKRVGKRNNTQINPGQSFGQLTTLEALGSDPRGRARWQCQCSCGAVIVAMAHRLRSGATWRCTGCAAQDVGTKNRKYVRTDPGTPTIETPEFKAWRWMRQAAELLTGIVGPAIDPTWDTDFEQFRRDLGPRPDDGSAWVCGRIDSLRGFVPENVEWQTHETRHRRQRNSMWWFVDNKKYGSCRAAAEALNVPFYKIYRWCKGYHNKKTGKRDIETRRGGCWTEPKYGD